MIWHGCYDSNWRGMITPESFAHPAKFARGLIERIFDHGFERGYWQLGSLICDPFGGIGTGGIVATYRGLRWVGCELEPRFVEMAKANFELHRRKWEVLGVPQPRIIQGDSRRLCEVVAEAGAIVKKCLTNTIASSIIGGERRLDDDNGVCIGVESAQAGCIPVAVDGPEGRIGLAVRESRSVTNLDSQLLQNLAKNDSKGDVDARNPIEGQRPKEGADALQIQGRGLESRLPESDREGKVLALRHDGGTGHSSPEQRPLRQSVRKSASALPVLPHARNQKGMVAGQEGGPADSKEQRTGWVGSEVCGIVTSPPWEASINDGAEHDRMRERYPGWGSNPDGSNRMAKSVGADYGRSPGQLGNESGTTYWEACALIYQQCLMILRPGGVLACVVKSYVKNKAIVDLPGQTWDLLQRVGLEPLERIRASLVKRRKHAGLFGEITETTERKSFFRRLAEKKGSPRIDFEEVLFLRKPGDGPGGADGCVTSPPFSMGSNQPNKRPGSSQGVRSDYPEGSSPDDGYGHSPGNLGNMPVGDPGKAEFPLTD